MFSELPRFGNPLSKLAASFTASASRRAPAFRWFVLTVLFVLWIVAGYIAWSAQEKGPTEAAYRTLGALAMTDAYMDVAPNNWLMEAARFAGVALPLVGLLFAFSGSLGRSLARVFNSGAARHVVIAGSSPGAVSLAHDCLRKKDSVFLIARDLPEETKWLLARRGGTLIEGDATRIETLRGARAHKAAHVVAFEEDEAANLQIEALMRRVMGKLKRRRPTVTHIATVSPMLLMEAREMRALEQRKRDADSSGRRASRAYAAAASMDPRPYSLHEIAARALIQDHSMAIVENAVALKQSAPHLLFMGFDEAAEAVAVRALMSLWSAHLGAPRLTVMTRDAAACERRFHSRFPQAFAHPDLWKADVAFIEFEWRERQIDRDLIDEIAASRQAPSAIVVSSGADSENIILALALKRACNVDNVWPVPILMKENTQSEFSLQYAKGDETAEHDAYLQAFGAVQQTATRRNILEGWLDVGAAMHHQYYQLGLEQRGYMTAKELQAATKDWDNVLETYREANRGGADAAMVRLHDAGWRPAEVKEKKQATHELAMPDSMMEAMARREHDRWVAERLMSGWRPGPQRDNVLRIHPNLKPWDALSEEEHARDVDQVRAAINVARMISPHGFMSREAPSAVAAA